MAGIKHSGTLALGLAILGFSLNSGNPVHPLNVAQFETNFDSPHLSPGVVLIRRYSSLSRGNSLMKGMMELPIRIRP